MQTLRVGVIGVGNIFKLGHFPSFERTPNIELAALCDINKNLLNEASGYTGVSSTYATAEEMLEKEQLDLIDICTPHHTHATLTKLAAENSVNVLCEKPIALTLREADEMIHACRKAGVKLMIATNERFAPMTRSAKKILEEEFGDPVNIFAKWVASIDVFLKEGCEKPVAIDREIKPTGHWRDDPSRYGSYTHDITTHLFDLIRYLVRSDAKRVYAELGTLAYPNLLMEDNAVTLVKFENNAIGTFLLTLSGSEAFGFHHIEIHGVGKTLVMDDLNYVGYSVAAKETLRELKAWRKPLSVTQAYGEEGRTTLWGGYEEEMRYVAECVKEDREPHNSGEDSRKSLEMAIATLKSAKEGRAITLPLASD
jgi:predicted dehydrogenase